MAVPPTPTVPNTPLLNVYNDEDNANVVTTRLPTGPCNFTNLSAGPNAPKCGCRRFWDQTASSPGVYGFGDGRSQQGTQAGWCMCQHHACFHDTGTEQATELQTGRGSVTRDSVLNQSAALHKALQPGEPQRSRVLGVGHSQSRGTLPDTLEWDRFLNSGPNQAYTGGLPPIPSQCLMPSDTSSIGSASQSRYSRPFGGLGLQTLSQVPRPNIQAQNVSNLDQGRPGNIREKVLYEDSQGRGFLQSLTDVASPSLKCSQTFDNATAFEKNVAGVQVKLQKIADANQRNSENNAIVMKPDSPGATDSQEGPTRSATLYDSSDDRHLLLQLRSIVNCVSDYPLKMQNHESRLDCLENASFCNAGIEELQDKHENLDNRVVDLESRVEEVEKAQAAANDASSIGSRQHLDGSFNSMASNTSSAIMAAAVDRVEYRSQIKALQAQVSELQASAVPSYQNPWEVEVVFLPFGSRLMGIWSTSHSLTQRSRSRTNSLPSDDWTQSQHNTMASAQACLTENDQAAAWEHSASDISGQQAWLMPKACGVRSRVDERLRSRGLVKTIQIRGPDARDVQAAMMLAFGDMPMILTGQSSSQYHNSPIPPSLNGFHGLRAPWVPLRKVHKEGILRFLTPSEMVTSALWTVPHLKSSVAMRTSATIRRLYVTQPDSYIQHHRDINAEWTWQKLRELPRVYPDSQSSLEVPEADAQELCWEYDERLDPSPSFHSSFASHHTSLSIRSLQHEEDREPTSPSDHFSSAAVSPALSTTPTSVPATKQLSPIKERHPFRPIHIRPASMSSLVPIKSSPSQAQGLNLSKRRIASFQQETQSSPLKASHTSGLKRRRISQSPTRPQDTPRWSIGPPSPSAFEEINVNERKRGNTPFAYATPHSNAPYVDVSRASPSPSDPSDYYPDDQASLTDDLYQDEEYDVQPYYDSASISDGEAGVTDVDDDMGHQPNEVWDGVQDEIATTGYHSQTGQRGKVLSLLAGRNENENEEDEDDDDAQSDASSQPSEYPSTQQHQDGIFALSTKGVGFRIHVDEEGI